MRELIAAINRLFNIAQVQKAPTQWVLNPNQMSQEFFQAYAGACMRQRYHANQLQTLSVLEILDSVAITLEWERMAAPIRAAVLAAIHA